MSTEALNDHQKLYLDAHVKVRGYTHKELLCLLVAMGLTFFCRKTGSLSAHYIAFSSLLALGATWYLKIFQNKIEAEKEMIQLILAGLRKERMGSHEQPRTFFQKIARLEKSWMVFAIRISFPLFFCIFLDMTAKSMAKLFFPTLIAYVNFLLKPLACGLAGWVVYAMGQNYKLLDSHEED